MHDDAWAIEQQIRRFAMLNDAHDHDGIAALFTVDGRFSRPTEPDAPVIGRDAIRSFFRDRPKRTTRHVMANTVVTRIAADRATAHSYVVLYLDTQVLVGDFHDAFGLEDGQWLFTERRGSLAFPPRA